MPLIPSESASFPDLLGRGLGASKKSKWRVPDEIVPPPPEPEVAKAEPVPPPGNSETLPLAETPNALPATAPDVRSDTPSAAEPMAVELLEPVNAPVLSPAQKKADTPTHAPIPIVRIARSIADRAPEATPDLSAIASAESIQPDQEPIPSPPPTLARPRLRPRPTLQPRFKTEHDVARTIDSQDAVGEMPAGVPVPVAPQYAAFHLSAPAPANEVEEFGFPESPATWSNLRARRRARFLRFVVWEVFALTITGLAGVVVLVHRPPDDALALTARIVTIAFAIAAATIPVVFYGLPETLPESDR